MNGQDPDLKVVVIILISLLIISLIFFSLLQKGIDHAHAFVLTPEVTRFCSVTQARGGVDMCLY